MALSLMYITNKPQIAEIAESAGVDRIFVDMEYIGKADRQGGMDTVQNHHTLEDVKTIAQTIKKAKLLVRINPIHEKSKDYISSEEEIDRAIKNGADILMLPYFKTVREVETFLRFVNGRVKTMLLLETPEAVGVVDDILKLKGIDEIFVGLNDLSLGYGKKFMFELLRDGTVEELCYKFKKANIPYGFGGIAALGKGDLPAEKIIIEHYRMGSTSVILSRSFCNTNEVKDIETIKSIFMNGIKEIRDYEKTVAIHSEYFESNKQEINRIVDKIVS
ncbi:alpha-dehydro-beta-deoxy-D-glucarate aldolase [Dorea longicatena]|uniref:Alpha-dehydro-beta-deoxy-D-glucarate aldolase n=1 Tax=Dorea longicatena TaxID=88431 RepID=A0A564UVL6_9FIRM|nr:aldolase/citrate lyase family protein [Dorea longicatena]VUX23489.1 alpha-dehydro-beta-deoxy-D-glucarate aldolase [Dorea longicatena]